MWTTLWAFPPSSPTWGPTGGFLHRSGDFHRGAQPSWPNQPRTPQPPSSTATRSPSANTPAGPATAPAAPSSPSRGPHSKGPHHPLWRAEAFRDFLRVWMKTQLGAGPSRPHNSHTFLVNHSASPVRDASPVLFHRVSPNPATQTLPECSVSSPGSGPPHLSDL